MKSRIHYDDYSVVRYYLNSELHRKDGLAIEYPNGVIYWYLNGVEFSPECLPCDYEYLKLKYLS